MQSSRPVSARGFFGVIASAALAVGLSAVGAFGQGVESEQLPAVKGAQAKPQQKAASPSGGGGGDAGLRERVEQLEGQLVDLQVVIGTLESLARTGGPVSAPARSEGGGGGVGTGDRARLDSMETQIRALTAQVEQLASEVRAQGQRRSDAAPPVQQNNFADTAPQTSRFGSTTVTSDNADPIGALADPNGAYAPQGPAPQARAPTQAPPAPPSTYGSETLPSVGGGGGTQFAAADPAASGNPKQLYETAYGHLLQQDYGSAQTGFREFLKSYPQDPLAPNALYWLGETQYVQRNYADAAEAFDLVTTAYSSSGKAADAQLKRGMSLAQLGKRQDACTALRGVASKFPSAPAQLKAKADSERQRIGCP
ncbi:tol-pal system protein YbgF [Hyphomicrobium sp.]|uniref:tol-pal system protein YbgF n=1 Tax=Hyphomicrobium sp. TaxID=82 RepID=UPI002E304172|nr:tol-pal system protein YbgF [Hyphomicrobium sp.]HEX2842435.1 tol-pal system protein YbgF [Hyphomicrobium sp.]